MAEALNRKSDESKMMLGFIVRLCAAELGHNPTSDEFAAWANGKGRKGSQLRLFGKEISPSVAQVMFGQPGRMVTVSPEWMARMWTGRAR